MKISRFDKETANEAHDGTILASALLPEGVRAPFDSAWGYLENGASMETHSHKAQEIYMVVRGAGFIIVEDEEEAVSAGDVIEVPGSRMHSMRAQDDSEILWAAIWWED